MNEWLKDRRQSVLLLSILSVNEVEPYGNSTYTLFLGPTNWNPKTVSQSLNNLPAKRK